MSDYTGHTPGPWGLETDNNEITVIVSHDYLIADVHLIGDGKESNANARLIAAAPDLLAQRDQLREALEIASLQIGKLADLTNGRTQAFAMMTKKGVDTALANTGGQDE